MKSLNELISEATRLFQNRLKIQNPASAETLAGEIAKDMIPSLSNETLTKGGSDSCVDGTGGSKSI